MYRGDTQEKGLVETKTWDRTMEREGGDGEEGGGERWKRGREERGIKPSRC